MADKMNIQFRIKAVDDFSKNMRKLNRQLNQVRRNFEELPEGTNIDINVADAKAVQDINKVERKLDDIDNRTIWTHIKVGYQDWRAQMGRMATTIRNFGELFRHQMISAFAALSPVAATSIGVIAGGLGNLGPIIGTTAGGIMGLGTAFGLAGAGVVGFSAVATSALSKVFEAQEDVQRLQERLSKTEDEEKRAEIMKEIATIQGTLSNNQQKAYKALNKTKSVWGDIVKSLEGGVVNSYVKAMGALSTSLERLKPMFSGVVQAANNLMDSLNRNLEAGDVREFFRFLNQKAAPAMETIGKTVGNFTVGLMNLMRAFGPLSVNMQEGFLGMSKSFRKWTDSLGDSEKFQGFIDYVRTNGPKLLDIIGSMTQGLVDMFAGFGSSSSDMMTGLQNLMNRFQAWANTLDENKQFQNFIKFIQENGPKFVSFMGQLIVLLTNIGIGFAQVGEKIMPLITKFASWMNGLMEGNRNIGVVMAAVVSLGGVIAHLYPIVSSMVLIFGKVASALSSNLLPIFTKYHLFMSTKVAPMFARVGSFIMSKVVPAFKSFSSMVAKAIPWVARIGSKLKWLAGGPVTIIIGIVLELAYMIYKHWDKIKAVTLKTFSVIGDYISNEWQKIKASFSIVKELVSMAISYFRDLKNDAVARLTRLQNRIESIFNTVTSVISNAVGDAYDTVVGTFQDILDEVYGLGSSFYDAGAGLIGQMASGISGAVGDAISAVSSVASTVRGFLPFSPAKEGPLSDLDKLDFGGPIFKSIKKATGGVQKGMANMMALPKTDAAITSSKEGAYRSRNASSTVVNEGQTKDSTEGRPIVLVSPDGKKLAEFMAEPMENELGKRQNRRGRQLRRA